MRNMVLHIIYTVLQAFYASWQKAGLVLGVIQFTKNNTMNAVKSVLIFSLLAFNISNGHCQHPFTNCSAAFLDQKIIVDEYTDEGKCIIDPSARGMLTVQTAYLSPTESKPTGKLRFRLAIRDGNTKTLLSFSDKTYIELNIQAILEKCRPGDSIVLLTTNNEYALPHNEILVKETGK